MSNAIILLVEDTWSDEELTLRALRRGNILNEVVVVRSGEEALEYLFGTGAHAGRVVSEMPAVLLLDLYLPGIGGLDVLREIRADARSELLPVIILTSSKDDRDLVAGYALGAHRCLTKPVDFAQFADAVGELGLGWFVVDKPSLRAAPP